MPAHRTLSLPGSIVVTAIALLYLPYSSAQSDEMPSVRTTDDCVQELKTWPAKETGQTINVSNPGASNLQDSIEVLKTDQRLETLGFKWIQIPGVDASTGFSSCISSILGEPPAPYGYTPNPAKYTTYAKNDRRDFVRLTRSLDHHLYNDFNNTPWAYYPKLRYFFTDNYERKYLFDFQQRIAYEMKRIAPDGSIESLGHWTGTYIEDPRIAGCRNSYGDPCGTLYQRVIGEADIPFYMPRHDREGN